LEEQLYEGVKIEARARTKKEKNGLRSKRSFRIEKGFPERH